LLQVRTGFPFPVVSVTKPLEIVEARFTGRIRPSWWYCVRCCFRWPGTSHVDSQA